MNKSIVQFLTSVESLLYLLICNDNWGQDKTCTSECRRSKSYGVNISDIQMKLSPGSQDEILCYCHSNESSLAVF